MHSDMWMPPRYDLTQIEPAKKYERFFGPQVPGRDYPPEAEEVFAARYQFDPSIVFFGNGLHRNLGGGRFEEVSDAARAETFWPWGVSVGDFDNDGFVDIYLPSGMGYPWDYWPSPVLRNLGDGTFEDVSATTGTEPPRDGTALGMIAGQVSTRSSRAAATADFDGDGRLDLIVNNFNDRPYLFMNRSPQQSYVALRLRGKGKNRDAIGAIVRLEVGGRVHVRQVHAAGGYLVHSSKVLHFGLGDATSIERCEILWPNGEKQVFDPPELNRRHVISQR
jgi:hypothetical protein